jgi:hypothetical protein
MEHLLLLKRKPVIHAGFLAIQPNMKRFLYPFILFMQLLTFKSAAQLATSKWSTGFELDALPYITGGWFGSVWAGKDHWRLRFLAASVKKPDFTTMNGFTNHHINAYALVADHFLEKEWKGWWLGGGTVIWNSRIQTDAQLKTASFTNYLLNGSAGYNFKISKKIYLSPWAGMSVRMGGDKKAVVDNKPYTLPLLNPEASLKLGIWF